MVRKLGQRDAIHKFRSSSSPTGAVEGGRAGLWGSLRPAQVSDASEKQTRERGGEKEEEAGERWGRRKQIRLGPV